MDTGVLLYLTYLAVIFLIGLLTSIASQKLRIPNILLLLLIGMALGKIRYNESSLIHFPDIFLISISILALVMIVFDSTSRFKPLKFDYFSLHTLWLSFVFLLFNLIFLALLARWVFGISWVPSIIFGALMSGTDFNAVLSFFKGAKSHVFEFLELESWFSTLFVILLPFLILEFSKAFEAGVSGAGSWILAQNLAVSVAVGVLTGLVMFKFIGRKYSSVSSPLAVIACALLAYILAENFNGNGVLAAASLGLLFWNVHLKHKEQVHSFSSVFSSFLEILVFVLIGLAVSIEFSLQFFINSLLLFIAYIGIRLLAIIFSLRGMSFALKEKIFMALNGQKGIAVAVVVFSLATLDIGGMGIVLNLSIAFILYSIILSSVALRIAKFFIRDAREKKG